MRFTILISLLASRALLVSASHKIVDIEHELPQTMATGEVECVYKAISTSDLSCNITSILECFEASTSKNMMDRIQQCLLSSGCTSEDSVGDTYVWAETCGAFKVEAAEEEELKKRKDESTTSSKDASTTSSGASSTSASSSASASASSTVAPSTTSNSPSSSTGSTLATSTVSATSSSTTPSSSSNTCYSYSTKSTSACTTLTSGTSASTCSPITVVTSACAAGLLCTTDSSGSPACMILDNNLTPSGIAIAVIFGVAIATFIITLLACFCKESRAYKKKQAERDAVMATKAREAAAEMEAQRRRGSRMPSAFGAMNRASRASRSPLSGVPLMAREQTLGDSLGESTTGLLGVSREVSPLPSPSLSGGGGDIAAEYSSLNGSAAEEEEETRTYPYHE